MPNNLNKTLNSANTPSFDPKTVNLLLNTAARRLGCTPEELKKNLQSGDFEKSVRNSDSSDPQMQKFKQLLNNPQACQKIMSDPKSAELIKKLSGK